MAIDIRVNGKHYIEELFGLPNHRKIEQIVPFDFQKEIKGYINSYRWENNEEFVKACQENETIQEGEEYLSSLGATEGDFPLDYEHAEYLCRSADFIIGIKKQLSTYNLDYFLDVMYHIEPTVRANMARTRLIVWDWVSIIYDAVLSVDTEKTKYPAVFEGLKKVAPHGSFVSEIDNSDEFMTQFNTAVDEISDKIVEIINRKVILHDEFLFVSLLIESFIENHRMWIIADRF